MHLLLLLHISVVLPVKAMGKLCAADGCRTNYKKQENGVRIISNKETIFSFPDCAKKPDLYRQWIRFVNCNNFEPKPSIGICSKHFDQKLINVGIRKTLKWELDPIPTNYCMYIPPSVLPTVETKRKPPVVRGVKADELPKFKEQDTIHAFSEITDALCPPGYSLELHAKAAIFYRLEIKDIPEVKETIIVDDKLHIKLFKKSIPIPLPEWFRSGTNCILKNKSTLENFPAYIQNYAKTESEENIPHDIMD